MKIIKYFFQFIIIYTLLILFKILGYKKASNLGAVIGSFFGPLFRSKNLVIDNIKKAIPNIKEDELIKLSKVMWSNYGRILSDYVFIKEFRNSKLNEYIEIEGNEILNDIKKSQKPVVFISGHFNNFELMAMEIEKSGIDLAAIFRPLNNPFLNKIMEKIRINHICKKQIPKGLPGVKKMLKFFKGGTSIALMIDQRVSQGINSNFFNRPALTTTIPAQLVKKFQCLVVPICIERIDDHHFKLVINKPINFNENETIESITLSLNSLIEKMILKNPGQWIWSHNRWK